MGAFVFYMEEYEGLQFLPAFQDGKHLNCGIDAESKQGFVVACHTGKVDLFARILCLRGCRDNSFFMSVSPAIIVKFRVVASSPLQTLTEHLFVARMGRCRVQIVSKLYEHHGLGFIARLLQFTDVVLVLGFQSSSQTFIHVPGTTPRREDSDT